MRRKHSLIMLAAFVAFLLMASGIYAGNKIADDIPMKNQAYGNHKEATVIFKHRKHQVEYREKNPELFNSQCGECHHEKVNDRKNKPLVSLKEGDEVKNCIECHKKAAYIKGNEAKGLSDVQKREYHANAMHDNCESCHKKYNEKKGLKSKDKGHAPTTCKSCHSIKQG